MRYYNANARLKYIKVLLQQWSTEHTEPGAMCPLVMSGVGLAITQNNGLSFTSSAKQLRHFVMPTMRWLMI